MTILTNYNGFEFNGLYCYPAEEAETYYFLPLEPSPETDPNGNPTLMSIPLKDGGYLQLGTHFDASKETLSRLRLELTKRYKLDQPSLIRLQMAPLTIEDAALLIADNENTLQEISHSKTSGYSPFTALFHQQLNAAQQHAADAAINGKQRIVLVRYNIVFSQQVFVHAQIEGDATDLLARLANIPVENDSDMMARQLLDEALTKKQLQLKIEADDATPPDLIQRASSQLYEKAVYLLLKFHKTKTSLPNEATVLTAIELKENVLQPLQLTTDIADWFTPENVTNLC